jgi:hypothetical protein
MVQSGRCRSRPNSSKEGQSFQDDGRRETVEMAGQSGRQPKNANRTANLASPAGQARAIR